MKGNNGHRRALSLISMFRNSDNADLCMKAEPVAKKVASIFIVHVTYDYFQ